MAFILSLPAAGVACLPDDALQSHPGMVFQRPGRQCNHFKVIESSHWRVAIILLHLDKIEKTMSWCVIRLALCLKA